MARAIFAAVVLLLALLMLWHGISAAIAPGSFWHVSCSCQTDAECAARCGGSGSPD
jgi:hypothetical protein